MNFDDIKRYVFKNGKPLAIGAIVALIVNAIVRR